jgi:hypothetical protein
MATDIAGNPAYPRGDAVYGGPVESRFSGVSWGAIIAGGVAAAALATILMTLGAGLGLIAVSPWRGEGASATGIGIGVIVWSIIVEVAAFGVGGYLAGRLRTKWANIHGDEVYFRDTAHGMVTWALGTLVFVALSLSAAGQIARTTAEAGLAAGGAAAGGAGAMMAAGPGAGPMGGPNAGMRGPGAPGPMRGNPMDYYVDQLFRPAAPAGTQGANTGGTTTGTTDTNAATVGATTPPPVNPGTTGGMAQAMGGATGNADLGPVRAEIGRIVAASWKDGQFTLAPADRAYIAQLISQRTGMSQADAEKRVDDTIAQAKATIDDLANKAKQAADDARKAAAGLALWSFVAMLIGAFVASYAATLGGRHRDT